MHFVNMYLRRAVSRARETRSSQSKHEETDGLFLTSSYHDAKNTRFHSFEGAENCGKKEAVSLEKHIFISYACASVHVTCIEIERLMQNCATRILNTRSRRRIALAHL